MVGLVSGAFLPLLVLMSDSDSAGEQYAMLARARTLRPAASAQPETLEAEHVLRARLLCTAMAASESSESGDEEAGTSASAGREAPGASSWHAPPLLSASSWHAPPLQRSHSSHSSCDGAPSGHEDNRGRYDRSAAGIARRMSDAHYAFVHRQRIESNMFGVPCTDACVNAGLCGRNITQAVLLAAHERVYGTQAATLDEATGAYNISKACAQIRRARRALMLSWMVRGATAPTELVENYMVEGTGPVCAEFAQAAYDFRDWTWNTMRAAAHRGSLQVDADLEAAGCVQPQLLDTRDTSTAEMTITWWLMWLRLEDQMPNEPVIVHRDVVFLMVYDEEYVKDMAWWACTAVSRSRWTQLRAVALSRLSVEYYGQVADCDCDDPRLSQSQHEMLVSGGGFGVPVCMLSVRRRAQHSNFASCNECADAKQEWIDFRHRKDRCSGEDAHAFKARVFAHIERVKLERQIAMEMHQFAAARSYQSFEYDDKCGSEFCFQPTPSSRHTAATAGDIRLPNCMPHACIPGV